MTKFRHILLLVVAALMLSGLSLFAGYKVGFKRGFEPGFVMGWKIGFETGAKKIFTALTGKPEDELHLDFDKNIK